MPSFQVPVLGPTDGFLSPFPDSLPQLFLRCFPYAFAFGLFPFDRLSFVCFSSGSGYSASVSSFPLSSRLRLTVASPVLPLTPFGFLAFPLPVHPVSRASLPFLSTQLSVCFLSSFPVSLPQPFLRCFPHALAFGLSPRLLLSFVRFCSLLTTQPSALSFPFFPFSPGSGSNGARRFLASPTFPLPFRLFPCVPSDSGTQLPAFPFSVRSLASQWLP